MYGGATAIKESVSRIGIDSGLPGHVSGPQDAFRHIVGAAELTRIYGPLPAWMALEFNELKGSHSNSPSGGPQSPEDAAMDRHNNEIGIKIGRDAKSLEEIIERARDAIVQGIANGGVKTDGAPTWLPAERWKNEASEPETKPIPENWGKPPQSGEATGEDNSGGAEPRAARMSAILAKPGRDWTDEDARVVMSDPRYWDPRRKDPALIERVNDSFHQRYDGPNGGPIQVDAYARADGTQVAAHTRAEPKRDRMPDAPTPMPQATPVPHASVVPRAKPVRGNRPPPRRKGRP